MTSFQILPTKIISQTVHFVQLQKIKENEDHSLKCNLRYINAAGVKRIWKCTILWHLRQRCSDQTTISSISICKSIPNSKPIGSSLVSEPNQRRYATKCSGNFTGCGSVFIRYVSGELNCIFKSTIFIISENDNKILNRFKS